MAVAPFGFGSAELFLNSAACVLGNLGRAAELQTNCAPPVGGMELVGTCRAGACPGLWSFCIFAEIFWPWAICPLFLGGEDRRRRSLQPGRAG